MLRMLFRASLLSLACACATTPTAVPVKGADTEINRLAGDWGGEYEGTDSGRKGSIQFTLAVGRHTAEGQVVMNAASVTTDPQPLQIKFVQVAEGQVQGKITPYTDPQCECTVETEFLGRVSGDAIDGTFTTRRVGSEITQHGKWSVVRKTP
ncbi:MAG: hypothetical protein HY698_15195 [Deltaproteobacteria bacterium]|nr:hypothetical protein [Deltaproteobacteria bacterium]